jgi:hypothetical protein
VLIAGAGRWPCRRCTSLVNASTRNFPSRAVLFTAPLPGYRLFGMMALAFVDLRHHVHAGDVVGTDGETAGVLFFIRPICFAVPGAKPVHRVDHCPRSGPSLSAAGDVESHRLDMVFVGFSDPRFGIR